MRNKKLLNTLVLFGVCASLFSLASCQGIKGEQGEPGTPGVDGKPGEDGKDGEDGNTWLTGEGTPVSSLGKNGDLYLDTVTSDYYIKKDGSWVKTGNLKGEDGEDGKPGENGKPGEDGEDGLNGSTGPKGDTAWSNTILPSTGGYITVDKGSAVVNEDVCFTFKANDNYKLYSYTLNYFDSEESVVKTKTSIVDDNTTLFTSPAEKMVKNGFVVSAKFVSTSSTSSYQDEIVKTIEGLGKDDTLVLPKDGTITLPIPSAGDADPAINLNGKDGVTINGNGSTITLKGQSTEPGEERPSSINSRTSGNVTLLDATNSKNVTISGFKFEGNGTSATTTAIATDGSDNLTIKNCNFGNYEYEDVNEIINSVSTLKNVSHRNNLLFAIDVKNATGLHIENNVFARNIQVNGGSKVDGLYILNNDFLPNIAHTNGITFGTTALEDVTISGNKYWGTGLGDNNNFIVFFDAPSSVYNFKVKNNTSVQDELLSSLLTKIDEVKGTDSSFTVGKANADTSIWTVKGYIDDTANQNTINAINVLLILEQSQALKN